MAKRARESEIETYTGPVMTRGDTPEFADPEPGNGLAEHESEPLSWSEVAQAAAEAPAEAARPPRKARKRRIGLGSSREEIDAALAAVEATLEMLQREQRQLKALREAIGE